MTVAYVGPVLGQRKRAEEEGAAERIRCVLTPTAVLLPATLWGQV